MPFYPTPNRDNGYDIADYYGVDPRLGSLGDVVELLRGQRARHPGDRRPGRQPHLGRPPWFQAAQADRGSPYRDFFVWADEPPADGPKDIVFPWPGDLQLGVRRGRRPVVPTPLLQEHAT